MTSCSQLHKDWDMISLRVTAVSGEQCLLSHYVKQSFHFYTAKQSFIIAARGRVTTRIKLTGQRAPAL